jgi:hypothetical protein
MNKPMSVPPNGGGGVRQRLLRGTLLKWNEVDGYFDRDGVRPVEGPYLLWAMENGYQRWKDRNVVDEIVDKPLPDLEQLNETIPKSEWEMGLDGHSRPPYVHQYCVYLLDPQRWAVLHADELHGRHEDAVGITRRTLGDHAASAWSRCHRGGQPRDAAVQDREVGDQIPVRS